MNLLETFNVSINGQNVSLEDLVNFYIARNQPPPVLASRAYAYYGKNDEGHFFKNALWHPDTVPDADEVKVPGYFVPDVRDVTDAQQLGIDDWQEAVRLSLHRLGVDEMFLPKDPFASLSSLVTYVEEMLGLGETKSHTVPDTDEMDADQLLRKEFEGVLKEFELLAGYGHHWTINARHGYTEYVHPRGIVLHRKNGKRSVTCQVHPMNRFSGNNYPDLHVALDAVQLALPEPNVPSVHYIGDIPIFYSTPILDAQGFQWRGIDVDSKGHFELIRKSPGESVQRWNTFVEEDGVTKLFVSTPDKIKVADSPEKKAKSLAEVYLDGVLVSDIKYPENVFGLLSKYQARGDRVVEVAMPENDSIDSGWRCWLVTPEGGVSRRVYRWKNKIQIEEIQAGVVQVTEHRDFTLVGGSFHSSPVASVMDLIVSSYNVPDAEDVPVEEEDDFNEEEDTLELTDLPELPVAPNKGSFYRHTDGGLYEVEGILKSSADQSLYVAYRHVWPFANDQWVRPLTEWHSRFTEISSYSAANIVLEDREVWKAKVSQARTSRKAREARAAIKTIDGDDIDPRRYFTREELASAQQEMEKEDYERANFAIEEEHATEGGKNE